MTNLTDNNFEFLTFLESYVKKAVSHSGHTFTVEGEPISNDLFSDRTGLLPTVLSKALLIDSLLLQAFQQDVKSCHINIQDNETNLSGKEVNIHKDISTKEKLALLFFSYETLKICFKQAQDNKIDIKILSEPFSVNSPFFSKEDNEELVKMLLIDNLYNSSNAASNDDASKLNRKLS